MATGMVAAPPCAVCGLASARIELVLTTRSAGARTTLERIWQATGRPERGGLNVWRPYEQMDWPMQEAMQHAAATALQLAADGKDHCSRRTRLSTGTLTTAPRLRR